MKTSPIHSIAWVPPPLSSLMNAVRRRAKHKFVSIISFPTGTPPLSLSQDRRFRTSAFDPMGANVAFLTRRCQEDRLEVALMVNERLTPMGGPCGGAWCDWSAFRSAHAPEECDYDPLCSLGEGEEREEEARRWLEQAVDDRF